jgi:hypothetical protein
VETVAVVFVLVIAAGWIAYAVRKANRTADRIIAEETETGPRVDDDRYPGGSGIDPRGPAV